MPSKIVKRNSSFTAREAAIHVHIGVQITRARQSAGLGIDALAGRLAIPVARLTRIESGADRLSARGLFEIAVILGRPVSYFFADLEIEPAPVMTSGDRAGVGVRVTETNALVAAFHRIPDDETRRDVVRLVRGIAEEF